MSGRTQDNRQGRHLLACCLYSFDGNATSIFRDIVPQTFTGSDGTSITIDNNAWPPAGPGVPPYFATSGYDMTTGFGSPRADRFVAALALQK